MKHGCDVAIIGGGAIGLACAWRLAQRGVQVELFERGEIGREASHAAAGMLAAQCEAAVHPPQSAAEYSGRAAFSQICLQSRTLYPAFAAELLAATEIDIELSLAGAPTSDWRQPGILYVSDGHDAAVRGEFESQLERGLKVENGDHHGQPALWLPHEGQVENRKLVAALKVACQRAGVTLHEYSQVDVNQLRKKCYAVLVCAGAWSSELFPEMQAQVRPVAGEVLAARPPERLTKILYSRDVYLVPRRDGRVLVGATMEERGFDKSTSPAARSTLLQAAERLVAGATSWTIEDHWAGLRPATADGLPTLGSTAEKTVFIATGHFRNGILLTPLSAKLMAECVLDGVSPPEEFSPQRLENGVLAPCV